MLALAKGFACNVIVVHVTAACHVHHYYAVSSRDVETPRAAPRRAATMDGGEERVYLQPFDELDNVPKVGRGQQVEQEPDAWNRNANPTHLASGQSQPAYLTTGNDPSMYDVYAQQAGTRRPTTLQPATPQHGRMNMTGSPLGVVQDTSSPPALVAWNSTLQAAAQGRTPSHSIDNSPSGGLAVDMDRELAAQALCEIHTSPGPARASLMDSPGSQYQVLNGSAGSS